MENINRPTSPIQMVDLIGQYHKIKPEIDLAIQQVLDEASFINGNQVTQFQHNLENYLGAQHVIPCANGTDALQLAFMALDLKPGDEVIIPAFTYVATAEVIALLQLTPVMVDVDPATFNISIDAIKQNITSKTKAIVPVHLFGQAASMEEIMELATMHNLYVIEDNAQAIGADYYFSDGSSKKLGTIGHIGTTSFFPSKNLGCYGDGGAVITNDSELAMKIKMMANHGQSVKYQHDSIGCNSRLDSLQAAVLNVKLARLDQYKHARNEVADTYDEALGSMDWLLIPQRTVNSNHVFHQYTLIIKEPTKRDSLKKYLAEQGIPTMIYYPIPLYKQKAYSIYFTNENILFQTEELCKKVLSLPIHTEMSPEEINYIIGQIITFKSN